MYKYFLKPLLDFLAAFIGFIFLLPIFLMVTILLYISNQGSPFFFQERPGKDERIFKIIKFKTMNDRKSKDGHLLPDKDRLTKVGSFVRKTSLDEIPQLINVLKGDMSLIGPRPLRTFYLPLYSEDQRKRHSVKPGITGWAQINGRNAISWSQKFEYDVWYVDHISLGLDLKIILKTISNVFAAKDINASEEVSMERFNGKN